LNHFYYLGALSGLRF